MSNHSGSYMLNEVLVLLEKKGFFAKLEPQVVHAFLSEMVGIGWNYDCNQSEILMNIGERLGVCYYCMRPAQSFEDGLCPACR